MKAREIINAIAQSATGFIEGFSGFVAQCFRDAGESPKVSLYVFIIWTALSMLAGGVLF